MVIIIIIMCIFLSSCCVILLYALPSCAVYLPMLPFAPVSICTLCYRITFVVWRKTFPKNEKKKKNGIRLVQKWLCIAILHVDMQNGYKTLFFFFFWLWKIQNGEKNKRLLNSCTSLLNSLSLSNEVHVAQSHRHIQVSLFLAEGWLADSHLTDSNIPVCQYSSAWADTARKTSLVHHVIT